MSQEIQLLNQSLPLQPSIAPQVLAPIGSPEVTPFQKIHRLLRGRYALACVLAAIGAAVGTAAGILLPKPAYESAGIIQIRPIIPSMQDVDKVMPLYNQYVADVMVQLHTDRLIKQAMAQPDWKQRRPYAGPTAPPDQVAEFSKNLTVKQMPGAPEMIQVLYDDTRKDAREVAQTAVSCLIKAWEDSQSGSDKRELENRLNYFTGTIQADESMISADRRQIDELSQDAGDQIPTIVNARIGSEMALEKSVKEAQRMLDQAEHELQLAKVGMKSPQGYSAVEIAMVRPDMLAKLTTLHEEQIKLQEMELRLKESHPTVQAELSLVAIREADIKKSVEEFNEKYLIKSKPDGSGSIQVSKDLTTLRDLVKSYQDQYKLEHEEIQKLYRRSSQIATLTEDISHRKARINENQKQIDTLNFQKEMGGKYQVMEEGTVPQPASDRRPVFAALGFLGGGALPVGLLLLVGLANPRYRFSDETGNDLSGLTLLGILPDLPDRLSDPEQASIAAHCVHQIRTMLQISGAPDERRVFAITSAAPGDGKTSLTLALGLSYAACGTRTLLIDCDLVGAGLTARMNVNSAEGVLEAITNRSLLEYVRSTDVADVSILPVGSAQTLHASTLSPAALRRLIDEAKKQFDTILVDTGPILGSIEASLVCSAADAVVLTVARGQQRPLVEKAIGHLTNIGARLAGVVFNRAQTADFDRSISGVSLRSVSSGSGHNGHDGPRFGTLGRAVHSHSKASDLNEG
jgi:capsular exopolysaccharide synthesis family protein